MLILSHRLGEYSKCGVKRYSHSFRVTCDKSAASLLESWEQRCIKAINNSFQESEQVRRLKKSLLCFTGTWVNLTTLKNRSRSGDWRRLFRTPGTTWSKCCACRIKWFSGELAGLISSLLDHCFCIQPACWLCTWTWRCFEPRLLILWFCGLNVAIWYICVYIYMCVCVLNSLISMLERGYVLVFLSAPSAACWASFALHAFIRRCFWTACFHPFYFLAWMWLCQCMICVESLDLHTWTWLPVLNWLLFSVPPQLHVRPALICTLGLCTWMWLCVKVPGLCTWMWLCVKVPGLCTWMWLCVKVPGLCTWMWLCVKVPGLCTWMWLYVKYVKLLGLCTWMWLCVELLELYTWMWTMCWGAWSTQMYLHLNMAVHWTAWSLYLHVGYVMKFLVSAFECGYVLSPVSAL